MTVGQLRKVLEDKDGETFVVIGVDYAKGVTQISDVEYVFSWKSSKTPENKLLVINPSLTRSQLHETPEVWEIDK